MRKNLLLGGCVFFLVLAAMLLLFSPPPHALASNGGVGMAVAPTATPDANAALNSANDALARAQDILNIVIGFTAVLGLVLTLVTVFAAALTALGVRSYREVVSRAQELRNSIAGLRADADKTRQALIYLTLGDRLLNQKNVIEALAIYQKAGSFLPNDSQFQYILGRIYSGAGDYRAAITALEAANKALEVSPLEDDAEARKEKALVLKELGLAYRRRATSLTQDDDYQQAQHYLEQSLSYNRRDSDAQSILGGLFRRQKEYGRAYDAYKEAYEIDPHSSYALGNVASLSWYLGKVDEAREYFHETEREARKRLAKGEMETFWDHYDLALAQLASGKIDEAKQTYALAISETPGATQFDGVLDNLKLLKQAPQPMNGLDEVITMVEDALNRSRGH